jgi:DNA-binding response OmpR family regulator
VEDCEVVAQAVEMSLQDAGMVIAGTASRAIDGERLARGRVPQLAIVDFQLGNDVAFDLIDHLRDLGVRVIVVSGLPICSPRLANAAAVLQKPFTGQELLEALVCAAGSRLTAVYQ